jgi:hypothetical protein
MPLRRNTGRARRRSSKVDVERAIITKLANCHRIRYQFGRNWIIYRLPESPVSVAKRDLHSVADQVWNTIPVYIANPKSRTTNRVRGTQIRELRSGKPAKMKARIEVIGDFEDVKKLRDIIKSLANEP